MKRRSIVFRAAALTSSVLLLVGYVAYRGYTHFRPATEAKADGGVTRDEVFVGTKSGPVFNPPLLDEKPKFIGGSKSAAMADPEDLERLKTLIPTPTTAPGDPKKQEQPATPKPKE